jgi:hypothetical protein
MLVALISWKLVPFAYDDAYIHFRIAENLAQMGQPYFNIGERIMATSSPVWTYLLASLSKLGLALPQSVAVINPIITMAGVVVWMRCLAILDVLPSRWITVLFPIGYVGIMIPACLGLMETPLAMLLLGVAMLLLLHDKALGWVIVALAIFTRIELLVFVPFFAISALRRKHTSIIRHISYFASAMAILISVTWISYGTLIPQAVIAKQIVYDLPRTEVIKNVVFSLLPREIESLPVWLIGLGACFLLFTTLNSISWKSLLDDDNEIWIISMGAGGTSIALAYIFRQVFLHNWYIPLFAIPLLFFFFGIPKAKRILHRIPIFVFLIVPLSILIQFSRGAIWTEHLPTRATGARVQRYLEVGVLLYGHLPDARLMTSEIGGLGYSFRGYILDGVGLITPDALKHHPIKVGRRRSDPGIGAIPAEFVNEEKPELIVTYPVFVEEFDNSSYTEMYQKLSMPAFSDTYQALIKENRIWGNKVLFVYIRNDLTDSGLIPILVNNFRATLD